MEEDIQSNTSITPGLNVKLVVEVDSRTERINARNSTVYDVDGERLVLAQTEPAIGSSMLHREITVTYLTREKNGLARHGFSAVINGFIDYYEVMSTREVQALAVRKMANPAPCNIRRCYRVEPTGRSGLDMSIQGKKMNILDISLGGVRFTYDAGSLELYPASVVEVRFDIGGIICKTDVAILRTWNGEDEGFRRDLFFAAAEFLNVTRTLEGELSQKIREIERDNLANEWHA
jgi:hypothetical protein